MNEDNDLDVSEFSMLSRYLEKELTTLSMKMISVREEIIKVVKALVKSSSAQRGWKPSRSAQWGTPRWLNDLR